MVHADLQRSIEIAIGLLESLHEASVLVSIALDCIDFEVDDSQEKVEILLIQLKAILKCINDDLPYRLRVVAAELGQDSNGTIAEFLNQFPA